MKTKEFTKIPPQALEIEESVLATCFLGNTDQVANMISPDVFYKEAHQKIFHAIITLHEKKEPVDLGTVYNYLRDKDQSEEVGGAVYLSNLIDTAPLAVTIKSYCKILKEKSVLRQLILKSNEIINDCYDSKGEDVSIVLEKSHQKINTVTYDSGSGFH